MGGLLTLVGGFAFNALTSGGGDAPAQQAQTAPPGGIEQTIQAGAPTAPALASSGTAPSPTVIVAIPTPTPYETRLFAPTFTPVPGSATPTPVPAAVASASSPAATNNSSGGGTSVPAAPASDPVTQDAPAAAAAAPAAPPIALTKAEDVLYKAHNVERERRGLPPLRIDQTLTDAARVRARDMATNGYFSHTSPYGEAAFSLLSWIGYRYALAGENIARNNYPDTQSPAQAMTGFISSPEHYAAMVNPKFDSVGVGYAPAGDGMRYYVLIFAGR